MTAENTDLYWEGYKDKIAKLSAGEDCLQRQRIQQRFTTRQWVEDGSFLVNLFGPFSSHLTNHDILLSTVLLGGNINKITPVAYNTRGTISIVVGLTDPSPAPDFTDPDFVVYKLNTTVSGTELLATPRTNLMILNNISGSGGLGISTGAIQHSMAKLNNDGFTICDWNPLSISGTNLEERVVDSVAFIVKMK